METFNIQVRGQTLAGSESNADPARGVFLFVHGLGEHMGRYDEVFRRMNKLGMVCLGLDHIGHGRSPGKRGHAPDYEFFMEEVNALARYAAENYSGLPVFLYGHSMGGNIAFNYLISHQKSLSGAVISSPWIRLQTQVPAFKKMLSGVAAKLAPSLTLPNDLDPSGISSDPEEVKRYVNDPLIHDRISTSLFEEMSSAAKRIGSGISQIHIPVLLIHGTADPITSHEGSAEVASGNEIIHIKLFPGSRHELHHDKSRESVFMTIEKWLEEVI